MEASNPIGLSILKNVRFSPYLGLAGRRSKLTLRKFWRPSKKTCQKSRYNLLLLGAPIFEKAIEGVLLEKLEDFKRMTNIDAHDADKGQKTKQTDQIFSMP